MMDNVQTIWSLLEMVNDPEIPVLSVVDLGIIRDVRVEEGVVEVVLTPTYSGCPAMDTIRMTIRMTLLQHGYPHMKLTTVLSPAWTTDWMSERGKDKLKAYGVAPPSRMEPVGCPQCRSVNTVLISEFGSTACKALYRCEDCREPFDHFKCH